MRTGADEVETPRGRPETPSRGPSMADVAARAQVSAQTVSRVSSGALNVRPETRARVQAVMDEMGYLPNRAAQALRSGTFHTIGVVAHRLSRTGISLVVEAVVNAASEAGYAVTLIDLDFPSTAEVEAAVGRLNEQAIDGLIIIRAETTTPVNLLLSRRLPVVINDSRFLGHQAAVGCDDSGGARSAVEHLLALGHRTVHHITGPDDHVQAGQREKAWRQTLLDAGRQVPEPVRGDWTPASGYQAGRILAADPAVTAVFCANDEMAAGLYRALHEAGRRVPEDVSVVGFDDVLAPFLLPQLTSVAQDFQAIGRQLVDVVLREMREGVDLADLHQLVPTRLVVRESTAAPRA